MRKDKLHKKYYSLISTINNNNRNEARLNILKTSTLETDLSENKRVLEGWVQVVPRKGGEVSMDDCQHMALDFLSSKHGTVVFQGQGQYTAS